MARGPNRLKGMADYIRLNFTPPESTDDFRARHAQIARQEHAKIMQEDNPSGYIRYVDGVANVPEEQVKFGGRIRYNYFYIQEIVETAMRLILTNSPVDPHNSDGRNVVYRDEHVILYNGDPITLAQVKDLPPDAEVWITNLLPYARKIEINYKSFYASSGVYEKAFTALKKYLNVASIKFTWAEYPGWSARKLAKDASRRTVAKAMRYPTLIIKAL